MIQLSALASGISDAFAGDSIPVNVQGKESPMSERTNTEVIDAIKQVLSYMWEDEFRDYQEQDDEGQQNHILNSLAVLDDYVTNPERE